MNFIYEGLDLPFFWLGAIDRHTVDFDPPDRVALFGIFWLIWDTAKPRHTIP